MLRCLGRSRGWEEEGLEKEALEGPVEALERPPTPVLGGLAAPAYHQHLWQSLLTIWPIMRMNYSNRPEKVCFVHW